MLFGISIVCAPFFSACSSDDGPPPTTGANDAAQEVGPVDADANDDVATCTAAGELCGGGFRPCCRGTCVPAQNGVYRCNGS
jgi:hypothetical protein